MKIVMLTDTHFGVKQNSPTWLKYQEKFIYEDFIPKLKEVYKQYPDTIVIHLGDVFDSRSTISTLVGTRVVQIIQDIVDVGAHFYIIGGNHDYYSPNSDDIDSLNLLLKNTGAELVTNSIRLIDEDNQLMLVPWYSYFETKEAQAMIDEYNVKAIFTHADIVTSEIQLNCPNIFSGHIHTPNLKRGRYNLGSCYPLTFSDANQHRHFYVWDTDTGKLESFDNQSSIQFYRYYNEDIFEDAEAEPKDYVELYINQTNLVIPKYIDKINEFTNKYKNIWVIPQVVNIESTIENFEAYDIAKTTKELIPEELKKKFERVLNFINEQ